MIELDRADNRPILDRAGQNGHNLTIRKLDT